MTGVDAPSLPGRRVDGLRAGATRSCACTLRTDPVSVPASRTLAAAVLEAWGLAAGDPVHQVALLALTELTTNSVRHAARTSPEMDITLSLTPASRTLTVSVHDRHPALPRAPHHPRPDGTGGWGLHLVESLAREWGGALSVAADPDGGGKTVRVRLTPRQR
jgi:anti-sigma regulatory factor (Ser/Thr protein kinase)